MPTRTAFLAGMLRWGLQGCGSVPIRGEWRITGHLQSLRSFGRTDRRLLAQRRLERGDGTPRLDLGNELRRLSHADRHPAHDFVVTNGGESTSGGGSLLPSSIPRRGQWVELA